MPDHVDLGASLPALVCLGASSQSNKPDPTRAGNGFHSQFVDDLAALASVGVTDVRLGFDWARLQPRPGDLDGHWVEWYSDVLTAASFVGVRIWAVLLERAVPAWFDDEGSFTDTKAAGRRWPRFVEAVAEIFGDRLGGWFPIDDPIGYAARTETEDPRSHGELIDTLIVAWRDAWRILHGGPPLATSLTLRHVRPENESPPALERARREEHLRFRTVLRALRDGSIVIPGRADRQLAGLAGAVDVIGIKVRSDLGEDSSIDDDSLRRWTERCQWIIHRAHDEGPDRPMSIVQRVNRRSSVETGPDAEVLCEAFIDAVETSRHDGLEIGTVFVEPGIAADPESSAHALVDWDRNATTVAATWQRRLH